jgi:DNA-binding MarR family transcriptional regulator
MYKKSATKLIADYELWALLDATNFAIYRLRQIELARIGLTIEQAVLLNIIQSTEHGATISWIKETTLRQQNTISITIDRMVKIGLVIKERKTGEREFRIRCTPKGKNLLDSTATKSLDELFITLSIEEKMILSQSLHTLLEKARGLLEYNIPPFMRYTQKYTLPKPKIRPENDDDKLSSYRLWMYLNTVRFTISRLRELELAHFGITVEQSSILKVLVDRGMSATSRELENATLRQHHTISTIVNRMMKLDLVSRERKTGERNYRIFITDQGKFVLSQMTTTAIDVTFCVLTKKEKQSLIACLRSLYSKARNLLNAPTLISSATVPSLK